MKELFVYSVKLPPFSDDSLVDEYIKEMETPGLSLAVTDKQSDFIELTFSSEVEIPIDIIFGLGAQFGLLAGQKQIDRILNRLNETINIPPSA